MKAWVSHYLSMITEEGQRIGKDGGGIAIRRIVPEMPNISAALLAASDNPEGRQKAVGALDSFGRAMRYSGISGASALDALEQEFVRAKDIIAQAKCKVARAGAARSAVNERCRSY